MQGNCAEKYTTAGLSLGGQRTLGALRHSEVGSERVEYEIKGIFIYLIRYIHTFCNRRVAAILKVNSFKIHKKINVQLSRLVRPKNRCVCVLSFCY